MVSKHYKNKRYKREKFINGHLNGDGEIIDRFFVDNGHIMGAEIHCVTENGIVLIYNAMNGKLVTKLIARENQIQRYYKNINKNPPQWLLTLCKWHEDLNYNK